MPFAWILLLSLCLLAGCASPTQKSRSTTPASAKEDKRPAKKNLPDTPQLSPAHLITGRIALVNPALRYVVVDFSLGRRPVAGQQLNVYRQGQKVGEIRISNQGQENNIAADITAGEIRTGDEARAE